MYDHNFFITAHGWSSDPAAVKTVSTTP